MGVRERDRAAEEPQLFQSPLRPHLAVSVQESPPDICEIQVRAAYLA